MDQVEIEIPNFCIERNSIVKTKILSRLWSLSQERSLRILDVGCGNAEWLIPLLDNIKSIDYFGIEPGHSLVLQARINLPEHAHQIYQGRGEDISTMFHSSFDVIISRAVFEHVLNRDNFINSITRALLPGGTLLLTYGTNHFKEGLRTDVRNFVTAILARIGYDRYYASPVNRSYLMTSLQREGLQILEEKCYSLDDLKMAHKLISDPKISSTVLLNWLQIEDAINSNSSDHEKLETLTNEMYFEALKMEASKQ
tara:strand:- start:580 stop:1344 length:765 start_codon:yes stop_codon:yes gene_type:complete